ncbi:DUF305 domain-containing protein [Pontibacter sp. E15-1]|uniref:DUF305 domain-containing protein n=1 Tax=Pontibacter sp. E15-1 TaxID=2919918 RepID=UPI001F501B8B|nr:DUF305 domain-containing protein [Pontibacter sp. E15-1]MCJ8163373.1 DUF305 domain-containing protein [Pontibacter sp. E15-1]
MNKLKFYTVVLLTALFSVACNKDEDVTPGSMAFHAEMDAAMQKMEQGMAAVEMTMDPDVDFAHMMLPHHQGSIDMSTIVLKYATHPELKEMAQKFIDGDTESKARLQAFLDAHGAPAPSAGAEFKQEMEQAMMKMNQNMKAYNMSNDPDYDFAETMTHHHQGAIDMSQIELKHGKDQPALNEAKMIIEHQQKDIVDLGKFRNEHGQPR